MKKSEFVQIKGLNIKDLKDKAKGLQKEIADLTLDKNMKKLKDLKMISKKKKELAQVLTVVGQKELLEKIESRVESLESSKENNKEVSKEEKVKTSESVRTKVSKVRKEKTSH